MNIFTSSSYVERDGPLNQNSDFDIGNFLIGIVAFIIFIGILLYLAWPDLRIHTMVYEKPDDLKYNGTICQLCFSEYQKGATLKVLSCDHHIHDDCITKWFIHKRSCPVCRYDEYFAQAAQIRRDPFKKLWKLCCCE